MPISYELLVFIFLLHKNVILGTNIKTQNIYFIRSDRLLTVVIMNVFLILTEKNMKIE